MEQRSWDRRERLTKFYFFQVWFQNRRAKFRKQERLAQQKQNSSGGSNNNNSSGSQQGGNGNNNTVGGNENGHNPAKSQVNSDLSNNKNPKENGKQSDPTGKLSSLFLHAFK